MKEKSQSKLAVRTRKWITDSLISLMNEKSFENISITEIVERADVSRQSFYRHYDTKKDVLDEYLYERIILNFKDKYKSEEISSIYDLFLFYFKFWQANSDVMEIVIKSQYNLQIFEEYDHSLRMHLSDSLKIIFDRLNIVDEVELETAKSFVIGGLYSVKIHWTKEGFKQTPEEIAGVLERMLVKN